MYASFLLFEPLVKNMRSQTMHDTSSNICMYHWQSLHEAKRMKKKKNKRLARRQEQHTRNSNAFEYAFIFSLFMTFLFFICVILLYVPLCLLLVFLTTNENGCWNISKCNSQTHTETYTLTFTFILLNRQSSSVRIFLEIPCSICTRFSRHNFSVQYQNKGIYAVYWSVCSWQVMRKMFTMDFLIVNILALATNSLTKLKRKYWQITSIFSECCHMRNCLRFISRLHAFDICGCPLSAWFFIAHSTLLGVFFLITKTLLEIRYEN